MGNFKVRVNNQAESKEAQELLQKLLGKENGFITIDKSIRWVVLYQGHVVQYEFLPSVELNELTLPELRAMVNPSLNDQYAEIEQVRQAIKPYGNDSDHAVDAISYDPDGCNIKYERQHRHYFIDVSDVDEIDFYEIALRYNVTDPCIQHILKKCLAVGQRGQKDFHHDLKDIYDTAKRMLDVHGLDS